MQRGNGFRGKFRSESGFVLALVNEGGAGESEAGIDRLRFAQSCERDQKRCMKSHDDRPSYHAAWGRMASCSGVANPAVLRRLAIGGSVSNLPYKLKTVSDSRTGSGFEKDETSAGWRDKSIFPLMKPPSSITIPAE